LFVAFYPAWADRQADSPSLKPTVAANRSDRALQELPDARKPPFALTDIAGAKHALVDYAGRPVLVHFFATWCEPCRPEMQSLERLAAREGPGRFGIVAISIDEPEGRVRRFFEKVPVSFPVLLDRDRMVARSWGVDMLPTTFVLDADLRPRLLVESDLEWDAIDVAKMLSRLTAPTSGAHR
jgi:peroxiredoxin